MNGWDFAREHSADPALCDIPICVVTAVGRAQPIPATAVAVVRKPLQLKQLLEVVRQHC
jgi:CheY-like chemotaxis protein